MEERIGGKRFFTNTEPIDPELLARANAAFDEFNSRAPEIDPAALPERFRDDWLGTEYEGWYQEREARRQREQGGSL